VEAGVLRLIGNDGELVRRALSELLADDETLDAMRNARNPYGDGKAGERVAQAVAWRLGLAERPADWQ
jgi:UDP-N-acetylglucosamine 2-epimerase (non-hydrolysing)